MARLPWLILQVSGLVEVLIVVDPEHAAPASFGVAPIPLTCGVKKRAATLDITVYAGKSVEIWNGNANGIAWNLRTGPLDRISDRSVAEHAEVVRLVRVLPDVLAVDHQIFSERLLQAGVEFIAMTGT